MPNCVLIYVLCVIAVGSFPLEEIGKNALVLKRVARQNNDIVQPNLVSTQYLKSNISAYLDTFFKNYYETFYKNHYGSNEGKGKNVFQNDEDHESYIEDEINFGSEDRNTGDIDAKATNHENIENTRESEGAEGEKKSTGEKESSEKINSYEYENNKIDNSDEHHHDLTTDISNYLNANTDEGNELFSIEKNQNTNFNEKDTPNSIDVGRSSESDEDYEDADEADYEHEVFVNDLDDDETNDDNAGEDFTNEDYNANEKVNSAESNIKDEDNDDKYRRIMSSELQNHNDIEFDNFQDNKFDSSNTINGKHKVRLLPENIDKNYFLTGSKNVKLGDDWRFSASKDLSYKPSGKRFKSKFSKNKLSLGGKGKWNFEDNHSVSDSAFGERANGQWSEDGNFNYHDASPHTNFGSSQK